MSFKWVLYWQLSSSAICNFGGCDWVPVPLKRWKKSCFSLALETETTESTWLSNARANFYNEYLEKITPSLSSLWIYSRTSKPSLFHTCYFDFTNIMGSKSGAGGKMEKLENPKRKRNHRTQRRWNVQLCKNLEKSGNNLFPTPKGWFLVPGFLYQWWPFQPCKGC